MTTPNTDQQDVQCVSITSQAESNHSDDTACNDVDQEEKQQGTHDEKVPSGAVQDHSPPDGGYGWLVVLGSFLSLFTVFGTIVSWGMSSHSLLKRDIHHVVGMKQLKDLIP